MTNVEQLETVKMLDGGQRIVKHPCGIEFKFNPNNGFEAVAGLQTWGARLEEFQFNDVDSLNAKVGQLHEFGENPIRSERTGEIITTHKEIYNVDTKEYITVMSEEYRLLQNKTLFGAFAKVAENAKLTPIGRIDVGTKGFTLGYATFMNPEFTITLLEQYPEPVALGLEFRNSFAGQMGVMMDAWGFQAFCNNFCQWGELVGSVWIPHNSQMIDKVEDLAMMFCDNVLKNSPNITKTCSDAESQKINPKDVYDILCGTNLPYGIIEAIAANPGEFNKRLPERDLTMFQLYACGTNAVTFRESKAYRSTLNYTEGLLRLLIDTPDKMIDAGKKRLDAYADVKSKQTIKREARKLAAEVSAQPKQIA